MNNINYDRFKIFSELFDDLKKESTNVEKTIFISTECWVAQLGERDLT